MGRIVTDQILRRLVEVSLLDDMTLERARHVAADAAVEVAILQAMVRELESTLDGLLVGRDG